MPKWAVSLLSQCLCYWFTYKECEEEGNHQGFGGGLCVDFFFPFFFFLLFERHRRVRTCTKVPCTQNLHPLAGEAVCQRKEVPLTHRELNAKAAEGGRGPETSLFFANWLREASCWECWGFLITLPICNIHHPSCLTEVIRVPNTWKLCTGACYFFPLKARWNSSLYETLFSLC